jgi:hypothetical protein
MRGTIRQEVSALKLFQPPGPAFRDRFFKTLKGYDKLSHPGQGEEVNFMKPLRAEGKD